MKVSENIYKVEKDNGYYTYYQVKGSRNGTNIEKYFTNLEQAIAYRDLVLPPKKTKYHAIKTEVDGITFDSKKEAKRYQELKRFEQLGLIKDLELQVPYVLIEKSEYGREIKYKADFVYFDRKNNTKVVEDVKGVKTPVYKLKKRIMAEKYGIEIQEV